MSPMVDPAQGNNEDQYSYEVTVLWELWDN